MKTTITEGVLIAIIGIVAATLHMVWLLKDDRTPNHTAQDLSIKKVWHIAGGVLHVWMGYVMEKAYGNGIGYLTGALMWLFFDGAINTWVLKKEWWYVGSTALVDKVQVAVGNWIRTDPRTVSAVLKLTFLLAAIVNVIFSS